jgi:hypothetical protein
MFLPPDDDTYEEGVKEMQLNYNETPNDFYQNLISKYGSNLNKLSITEDLINYCRQNDNEKVFALKKLLDTNFSNDIHCNYNKHIITSNDYGCDLREIIYNRNGDLNNAKTKELLDIFASKQMPTKVYHILTDVDDTLFAHTAAGVAGADTSWPEKVPYPGIVLFYQLFYNKLQELFQYSTILSATPGVMKASRYSNSVINSILKKFSFIQGNLESKTRLLTSGILSGVQGVTQHVGRKIGTSLPDWAGIHADFGNIKFQRYQQYKTIFPEYKFIFIGDNGQGDVLAGKQMLNEPGNDTIVCIHKVVEGKLGRKEPTEEIPGLYYFNDYYELAKQLQTLGIFDENDVAQIAADVARAVNEGPANFSTFYQKVPNVTIRGGKKTKKIRRIKKYMKTKKNKKQNRNKNRNRSRK